MAEFEITINKIRSSIETEQNIAEKIVFAGREVTECQNALDTSVSRQYEAIKRNLSSLNNGLSYEAGHMRSMAQALEGICGTYDHTESEITGQKIEYKKTQEAVSYASPSINETKSEIKAKDILSFFSKTIKVLNEKKGNTQAKTAASFLSTFASGLKLSDSDDVASFYTAFIGFSGSTIGLGGKIGDSIVDLAEKYGTESMKAWFADNKKTISAEMGELGTIGSSFGVASSFLKTIQDSDSVADFLRSSDGWLNSGKDLIWDLKGVDKEFQKENGGPISALISMGSYFSGGVVDIFTDDQPLTIDGIADLYLGTGLTGLKSGVSTVTRGIVDIDTDRSMNIFNKNTDWTAEKISSLNISKEGQVAIGVVATPVVAAWSLGETFVDFGWQIGDKIKSVWK